MSGRRPRRTHAPQHSAGPQQGQRPQRRALRAPHRLAQRPVKSAGCPGESGAQALPPGLALGRGSLAPLRRRRLLPVQRGVERGEDHRQEDLQEGEGVLADLPGLGGACTAGAAGVVTRCRHAGGRGGLLWGRLGRTHACEQGKESSGAGQQAAPSRMGGDRCTAGMTARRDRVLYSRRTASQEVRHLIRGCCSSCVRGGGGQWRPQAARREPARRPQPGEGTLAAGRRRRVGMLAAGAGRHTTRWHLCTLRCAGAGRHMCFLRHPTCVSQYELFRVSASSAAWQKRVLVGGVSRTMPHADSSRTRVPAGGGAWAVGGRRWAAEGQGPVWAQAARAGGWSAVGGAEGGAARPSSPSRHAETSARPQHAAHLPARAAGPWRLPMPPGWARSSA